MLVSSDLLDPLASLLAHRVFISLCGCLFYSAHPQPPPLLISIPTWKSSSVHPLIKPENPEYACDLLSQYSGGLPGVRSQPDLYGFQASQGYKARLCLKTKIKSTKQNTNTHTHTNRTSTHGDRLRLEQHFCPRSIQLIDGLQSF